MNTAKPTSKPSLSFGTTPALSTSTPLFGSTSGTSTFAAPATSSSTAPLFGSATTTSTSTLFPTSATSTSSSLFGAPAAKTSTTTSLFGGPTAASTPSLFGSTATTAAPASTTPSLGLGGTTQTTGTVSTAATGTGSSISSTTAEKENVRDGEVPQQFSQLVTAIKTKLKENRTLSNQYASAGSDGCVKITERVKKIEHELGEAINRNAAHVSRADHLSSRAHRDLCLGKKAAATQESLSRTSTPATQQQTLQYIISLIEEYDTTIVLYQETVEHITVKMREIMDGKLQVSTSEMKEYLTRFDAMFSTVYNKLSDAVNKVEDLRARMTSEGNLLIGTPSTTPLVDNSAWTQLRGASSFPSQSSIIQLGALMKPAQAAAPAATSGGLFGGASSGGSLFSSTQTKPLFGATTSSSSLFPTLNTTTTTQSTSLFPSVTTSKPATSFGSTLSTNTTGLLFSSKK